MDSGGASRLDICAIDTGELLLSDRFGHYRLTHEGELKPLNTDTAYQLMADGTEKLVMTPDAVPVCLRQLGRFAKSQASGYGFIPASSP
jgi:hypothetical protein